MVECEYCGEYLEGEPEEAGARCPRCREPLHERRGAPRLESEMGYDDDRGLCSAHPGNVAVGTCRRCGNFICPVCRTRWDGVNVCMTCLNRSLSSDETSPEEARTHRRQAVWSVWLGLGTWASAGFALLMAAAMLEGGGGGPGGPGGRQRDDEGLLVLFGSAIIGCLGMSVLGIGMSAAALRTRGDRMLMATGGLVLNAIFLGAMLGMTFVSLVRR